MQLAGMGNTMAEWFLYLVQCRRGTLYTGITTDVERRFAEHQAGGARAARYLRGKGPLQLVYTMSAGNKAQAATLEYRVKRLSRAEKLRLIAGEESLLDIGRPERPEISQALGVNCGA